MKNSLSSQRGAQMTYILHILKFDPSDDASCVCAPRVSRILSEKCSIEFRNR